MNFEILLSKIKSKEEVNSIEILSYLSAESINERCQINLKLAEAYAEIKDFKAAQPFVKRAWLFSQFSEEILSLYILIHKELDDIPAIQDAYKRLGRKKSAEGKIIESINNFNLSMYAYANHKNIDKYEYDFEILDCIERMAEPYKFYPPLIKSKNEQQKIRVAYLTYLTTVPTSVFYRINLNLAKLHDTNNFEIAFFITKLEAKSKDYLECINNLKKYNCQVITTSDLITQEEALIEIAQKIYNFKPDLLVTNAGLADLRQYFIMSLTPAPIIVNALYAGPPQYVSPKADWSISATKHPLLDSPCNCSLVPLESDLSNYQNVQTYNREDFKIPSDSLIILSGGRHPKFQSQEFWEMIMYLMRLYDNLYYVVLGIKEEQIPLRLPEDIKLRLRVINWRDDYLRIIGLADVVIDTFPSGGGFFLVDAMALGVPVVSFANDYMKIYDQNNWSLAEDLIIDSDLIIERGNFKQFIAKVSKLLDDSSYRNEIGNQCKNNIQRVSGKPERFVKEYENIYKKVLESALLKEKSKVNNHQRFLSASNRYKLSFEQKIQGIYKMYHKILKKND